jgi:hypothetical protein
MVLVYNKGLLPRYSLIVLIAFLANSSSSSLWLESVIIVMSVVIIL